VELSSHELRMSYIHHRPDLSKQYFDPLSAKEVSGGRTQRNHTSSLRPDDIGARVSGPTLT
jgi:hypothetical protein